MNKNIIFCDFDGTITKEDTIDKLLDTYANEKWLEIESLWEEGLIGSKECLERQVNCIDYLSEKHFEEFIDSIEIDEYFSEYLSWVKTNNIDFYVVSDGFDLIIDKIFAKYGIKDVKKFSNMLYHTSGKLKPFFPLYKENCESGAGVCKCRVLKENSKNKRIVYIGDGRSDMCATKHADLLFAKGKLAKYCSYNSINCIEFTTFKDILEYCSTEEKIIVTSGFALR